MVVGLTNSLATGNVAVDEGERVDLADGDREGVLKADGFAGNWTCAGCAS